ncbi:MAG: hypothetical protein ACRD2L_20140 [Terriglobia bacterium]
MSPAVFLALIGLPWAILGQEPPRKSAGKEQSSTSYLYAPANTDGLGSATKVSEHQKLLDEKNYERTTAFRALSMNGGERVDREESERSRRISDSQYQIERTIRTPDLNGRLATQQLIKEDHQLKGNTEETQSSYYQPDINGKMTAQVVENETITKISPKEKRSTRALYRPDSDGKFALNEIEEGSEKKLSDTLTVKESSRKLKEAGGRMAVVENVKETTTKTGDNAFKKETVVHQTSYDGRLLLTDRVTETQSETNDGVRKYQRLLESRNLHRLLPNVNNTGLTLSQRVTGEERRLPDGTVQATTQVETVDPANPSGGLRVSEVITETSKPVGNGKVSVERTIKTRDTNGNLIVSQKVAQSIESGK